VASRVGVSFLGVSETHWSKQSIDNYIRFAKKQEWDKFGGTYGGKESKLLYDTILATNVTVKGKNVLVIGSIKPWVESIFLSLGANQTVTLEYNKIISRHPQVM
jgi:hypothetical protein